ncbi:MAG: ribonuclease P protein component 4 [Candidatus Nanosalina sp.]
MASIAEERIKKLLEKAEERERDGRDELSRRYIELARKIGERTQTEIPRDLQKKFCSNCNQLLNSPNVKIRKKENFITYRCLNCGEREKYAIRD